MRVVSFTVSIDAEEDQWGPGGGPPTVAKIGALREAHRQLTARGLRTTCFVTQPVAETPSARDVLRELAVAGNVEIGAHLHPWTTRPLDTPCASMLTAVPPDLQRRKLASLSASLREAFGVDRPPFRAGRWALGPDTAAALAAEGYTVDSSVMPGVRWEGEDGTVDFEHAARRVHRFAPGAIGVPDALGPLIEVPVSVGCTRAGHRLWDAVRPTVRRFAPLRRASALLHRSRLGRHVQLTPEFGEPSDLAATTRALLADGETRLHVFWHSQSHAPPAHFVKTPADVTLFWRRLDAILDAAHAVAGLRMATVGEVAAAG